MLLAPLAFVRTAMVVVGAVAAGWFVGWLIAVAINKAAKEPYRSLLMPTYRACRRLTILILALAALYFTLRYTGLPHEWMPHGRNALRLILVLLIAWLVAKALRVTEAGTLLHLPQHSKDPAVRRTRNEIRLLRKLAGAAVAVLAIGWVLTTFDALRSFGVSLLTSAAALGVIVGLAARNTLGNVLAGLQVVVAHAMQEDDVVVVNDEWGRVEEVSLTHVVMRMWDERRLTLPTTYFTERPFQNLTRHDARVVSEVTLHLDFTAELNELRSEAQRLLEANPLWERDNKWQLQMVDVTPQSVAVQLRAWAADSPSSWNLACDMREALTTYVRERHPQWLPRTRGEYHP
ncbi:mechanosensitive ion channel family protein [Micromonospora sp. NPDC005806]|uniref:mechanosensitive ion channel family protein n=1 Tax=Micromonospora sp. NPDC005806 TaxID=3364234 RepID=UPI0036CE36C1